MSETEYAICEQTKEEKPYEKFIRYGAESLSDEELLALIIRTGTVGKDALALAGEVLHKCGKSHGLIGLHHLEVSDLMQIGGIGEVKAVKIKCIAELSNRIARQKVRFEEALTGPAAIAAYFMESMRHLEYEKCIAVYLDSKCHILSETTVSIGSISHANLSKRELFRHALKANAAQIILLHNHPSGDPTPSREDALITEKVQQAARLMEIPLVDHIIIGDNTYFSFREEGILKL